MRLIALLLALAMIAAACSGGGDSGDSDTATGDDVATDDGDDGGDDEPDPEPEEEEEEAVDLGNVEVDEEAASCANEDVFVPGDFNPGPGLTMAPVSYTHLTLPTTPYV